MNRLPKVLFLSTGNSTRSQMAEGFLRNLAGDRFVAASAGIEPGSLNPVTVEVMKEAGIDISGQHAKDVKSSLKEHFGYVITVSDDAKERAPIFPFTRNLLHWSITDPSTAKGSNEEIKNAFRRVRDQVSFKVRDFLSEHSQESKPASANANAAARTATG
jgi:arsenate reductase